MAAALAGWAAVARLAAVAAADAPVEAVTPAAAEAIGGSSNKISISSLGPDEHLPASSGLLFVCCKQYAPALSLILHNTCYRKRRLSQFGSSCRQVLLPWRDIAFPPVLFILVTGQIAARDPSRLRLISAYY